MAIALVACVLAALVEGHIKSRRFEEQRHQMAVRVDHFQQSNHVHFEVGELYLTSLPKRRPDAEIMSLEVERQRAADRVQAHCQTRSVVFYGRVTDLVRIGSAARPKYVLTAEHARLVPFTAKLNCSSNVATLVAAARTNLIDNFVLLVADGHVEHWVRPDEDGVSFVLRGECAEFLHCGSFDPPYKRNR